MISYKVTNSTIGETKDEQKDKFSHWAFHFVSGFSFCLCYARKKTL